LKQFNEHVSRISELHSRSINTTDEAAGQRNAAELEELVEETSALSNTLKRRIKALERQGGSSRDREIKKQQVRGFVDAPRGPEGLTHPLLCLDVALLL
jgi:syntaxin 1B/2/3